MSFKETGFTQTQVLAFVSACLLNLHDLQGSEPNLKPLPGRRYGYRVPSTSAGRAGIAFSLQQNWLSEEPLTFGRTRDVIKAIETYAMKWKGEAVRPAMVELVSMDEDTIATGSVSESWLAVGANETAQGVTTAFPNE